MGTSAQNKVGNLAPTHKHCSNTGVELDKHFHQTLVQGLSLAMVQHDQERCLEEQGCYAMLALQCSTSPVKKYVSS